MSHIESVSVVITDLNALKAACTRLGVEFLENAKPAHATSWGGRFCNSWDAAHDRTKATAAYRLILDHLAGARGVPEPFALCSRFHFAGFDLENLVARTVAVAEEHGFSRVFLLADSKREQLAALLAGHGIESVLPTSSEMASDFDRTRENQLKFLSDWKRLSAASVIVANPVTSALTYPARSFGAAIHPVLSQISP